jgi:hypothetical protein
MRHVSSPESLRSLKTCFVVGPFGLIGLISLVACSSPPLDEPLEPHQDDFNTDNDAARMEGSDGIPFSSANTKSTRRKDKGATFCDVGAPAGTVAMAASDFGVLFGVDTTDDSTLGLQVAPGAGCSLDTDSRSWLDAGRGFAEDVEGAPFDLDDNGNVYVYPSNSVDVGQWPDTVVRVDTNGTVSEMLYAGRGIWNFGVSPAGDTFWYTPCAGFALYSPAGGKSWMQFEPEDTLKGERATTVLSGAETLWTISRSTCKSNLNPGCGLELTRKTPEGTRLFDSTVLDFGKGRASAALSRCGTKVCGTTSSGLVVWNEEGEETARIPLSALSSDSNETIIQSAGNSQGVYVLLQGESTSRVVFVPYGTFTSP